MADDVAGIRRDVVASAWWLAPMGGRQGVVDVRRPLFTHATENNIKRQV
jgi:hypothetical protein